MNIQGGGIRISDPADRQDSAQFRAAQLGGAEICLCISRTIGQFLTSENS